MKKIIYVGLIALLMACGSKKTVTENKQDSTSTQVPSEQVNSQVESSLSPLTEITADNAKSVTSFENTPESVVTYFFASKIRTDNEWEKVCLPKEKRSDKFTRGLKEYDSWIFTKYKYVDTKEFEKNKLWVKIYMEITFKGDSDSGEDEVTVELVDGKWLITEVPT